MPGFRFLSPLSHSLSLSFSSCDCMCYVCQWMLMLWILSLGALSNTHAIGHKYTHTHICRDPATHPQAALGDELWQDLCSLTSFPAVCFVTATLQTHCSVATAYVQ